MKEREPDALTKPCVVCFKRIPMGAQKCSECKSAQGKPCNVCGERLLPSSKRCNACQAYQSRWPRLSTIVSLSSLALGVIGVISAATSAWTYVHDESNTRFKLTGAGPEQIYVKAWNSGRKPSALVAFRLVFDRLPGQETTLDLSPEDKLKAANVIAPGAFVDLILRRPVENSLPVSLRAQQYRARQVQDLLHDPATRDQEPLTLKIDVEESSDPPGTHRTYPDHFTAQRISDFITRNWGPQ